MNEVRDILEDEKYNKTKLRGEKLIFLEKDRN